MKHKKERNIYMKKFTVDPLNGSLVKGMFIFALPIIGVSLMTTLFSVIDTVMIGQFGQPDAISAIGVSSAAIGLLVSSVTGLSAGVITVIGKLYGKGDTSKISQLLHVLPLSAFSLGLMVCIIAEVFSCPIMGWLNCPSAIYPDALLYFRIYFLAVPAMTVFQFLACVIQAKGDSFHPLLFEVCSQITNILLNLFFLVLLKWNVRGVVTATVISQYLNMFLILSYLMHQQNELHLSLKRLKFFAGTKEIWEIGIPASVEGIILNITGVIISAYINSFDVDVISGNTIAQSIESLIVISFIGFANAGVVFISQNYGSKNYSRVKKCFVSTILLSFFIGEILGIFIYANADRLLLLFTNIPSVMHYARIRLSFMCLSFGLCGITNVGSGCIRGLSDAKSPLIISLISSVGFRLLWIVTIARMFGTIEALYIAMPLCWLICSFLDIIVFIHDYRKSRTATLA